MLTWTLIHSLWIGAVVVILSRAGAAMTNKAHLKGKIRLASLFLFLIATGLFFLSQIDFRSVEYLEILIDGNSRHDIDRSLTQRLATWISSNSLLISMIWLAGSILNMTRYYLGCYRIKQIRHFSSPCKHAQVLESITKIVRQLRIQSKVDVRISALINSPLTSGWIKPVIYLPIGMITGFSTEEIETILYHEMVHIKRKDYLVNLVLASLETLFFFNPFVLVIIKEIRNDMEYACDDRVIEFNEKLTYVHALVKLQELRITHKPGLAAKGNNSEFIKRINKMMNRTNNSNEMSKLIPGLIICLFLMIAIIGSAFIGKAEPAKEVIDVNAAKVIRQDTIKVGSKEELGRKIKGISKDQLAETVFVLNGKVVPVISGENLDKGETMMKHIKKELMRDGILSAENKRVKLMFQYSDLLNGKEVLGDKYPKYKKIFNSYFPTYDSYATTKVFKFDN